ncbi:MAG: Phytochelatin synthase [Solimicrobium sp.]|jgi:hypothetical protein|nr:Phytochelatin synthase [Solimicrobium sp.]
MKLKLHSTIFYLFLTTTALAHAVNPLPASLVDFASKDGQQYFERSMDSNSLKLLSNFTTQSTTTYCGVASLVMVLNSSNLQKPEDLVHKPFRSFTQDNFFNENIEKNIVSSDVVKNIGITLDQLAKMATHFGLTTTKYHANEFKSLNEFKKTLVAAISKHEFIIVNFLRSGLKQEGGGHHSPLAAYDKKHDRFLLLDVARYKYPAFWVKTEDLWNAINTEDADMKRLYPEANSWRGIIVMNSLPHSDHSREVAIN